MIQDECDDPHLILVIQRDRTTRNPTATVPSFISLIFPICFVKSHYGILAASLLRPNRIHIYVYTNLQNR